MRRVVLHLACAAVLSPLASLALAEAPHWGYDGDESPADWGRLAPEYALCAQGKNQSPVNIDGVADAKLPTLKFEYTTSITDVINNGHTIQANFAPGSFLTVGTRKFQLVQIHFHAPSENLVTGKQYPLEGHLVHQDAGGALAVVAVLFESGADQFAISQLWHQMPEHAGDSLPFGGTLTAMAFLPAHHDYYYFSGSLTTPPCSEGVSWMVLKQPVKVGDAQVRQFSAVMHHPNNRPVQPLNARIVVD